MVFNKGTNLFTSVFTRCAEKLSHHSAAAGVVPVEYHPLPQSASSWQLTPTRFRMIPIHPNSPESLRKEAREYMLRSFYQEAPIPLVLGFNDRIQKGCKSTVNYLFEEIDAHLKSGVSVVICDNDDMNRIVGCGFSRIWEKDDSYVIDYSMDVKSWHNSAASKAAKKDIESQGILQWRSLQTLHIYNLGQKLLKVSSKKYALYLYMLHISTLARANGLSSITILNSMIKEIDITECLVYCQSNFLGFDKVVYKIFPNPQIIDQVKYKDEELVINGERCFQKIHHLDGIKFFVEFFHSNVNSERNKLL